MVAVEVDKLWLPAVETSVRSQEAQHVLVAVGLHDGILLSIGLLQVSGNVGSHQDAVRIVTCSLIRYYV